MAKSRPEKTLADYVAIAISPLLIMALSGSLAFFLLELTYAGGYAERLRWTLFWFVFASVLVGRIAVEQGSEHAALFGVALAAVTGLAAFKLAPDGALPGLFVLAIIWWSVHQLTFDCTLIDDSQDASGEGLLQASGLDAPGDGEGARTRTPWWKSLFARPDGSRAPGTWVVYFSLAALPLFGIGQVLIPASQSGRRDFAFFMLLIYVASALGLLLTTSFLGLRRYLRQRNLKMPVSMAALWMGSGVSLIAVILGVCLLLPRPDNSATPSDLVRQVSQFTQQASQFAQGGSEPGKGDGRQIGEKPQDQGRANAQDPANDPNQPRPQQNEPPRPGEKQNDPNGAQQQPGDGPPQDQAQGKPQADQQGQPMEGGKGGDQKGDSKQADGQKGDQPPKQKQEEQDGGEGKRKDGQEQANQGQAQQPDQKQPQPTEPSPVPPEKQRFVPQNAPPQKVPPRQQQAQPQQQEQQPQQQAQQPPDQQQPPPPPPPPPESTPPAFNLLEWIGEHWRTAIWLVLATLAAIFLIRNWSACLAFLSRLWAEFLSLFGVFSRPPVEGEGTVEEAAPVVPLRPFSEMTNPFRSGDASRMKPAEVLRLTFVALQAWAQESGFPRRVDQTPLEFVQFVATQAPRLSAEARELGHLYSQMAYASQPPTRNDLDVMSRLWRRMEAAQSAMATADDA